MKVKTEYKWKCHWCGNFETDNGLDGLDHQVTEHGLIV